MLSEQNEGHDDANKTSQKRELLFHDTPLLMMDVR